MSEPQKIKVVLTDIEKPLSPLKEDIRKRKEAKAEKRNKSVTPADIPKWDDVQSISASVTDVLQQYSNLANLILSVPSIYPEDILETVKQGVAILNSDIASYIGMHAGIVIPCIGKSGNVAQDDLPNHLLIFENLLTLGSDIVSVIQPTADQYYQLFDQYSSIAQTTAQTNNNSDQDTVNVESSIVGDTTVIGPETKEITECGLSPAFAHSDEAPYIEGDVNA